MSYLKENKENNPIYNSIKTIRYIRISLTKNGKSALSKS